MKLLGVVMILAALIPDRWTGANFQYQNIVMTVVGTWCLGQ
jgi:hypothetical protein